MPSLDIYALGELEDQIRERLDQNLEQILTKLNREEKLEEFLSLIEMKDLLGDDSIDRPTDGKIIVIGESDIDKDKLLGIAKQFGFTKDRFEFHLEYAEAKTYNFDKTRWSRNYSCIFFGPVPHSGKAKENFSSIIARLETEDGFPHCVRLGTSGTGLKITKTSFREGMQYAIGKGFVA